MARGSASLAMRSSAARSNASNSGGAGCDCTAISTQPREVLGHLDLSSVARRSSIIGETGNMIAEEIRKGETGKRKKSSRTIRTNLYPFVMQFATWCPVICTDPGPLLTGVQYKLLI